MLQHVRGVPDSGLLQASSSEPQSPALPRQLSLAGSLRGAELLLQNDVVAEVFKQLFPHTFFCVVPIHNDKKARSLRTMAASPTACASWCIGCSSAGPAATGYRGLAMILQRRVAEVETGESAKWMI